MCSEYHVNGESAAELWLVCLSESWTLERKFASTLAVKLKALGIYNLIGVTLIDIYYQKDKTNFPS